MAKADVVYHMTLDTSDLDAELERSRRSLTDVAADGVKAFAAVGVAAAAAGAVLKKAWDMASDAAAVEGVEKTFARAGGSIDELRHATSGLIGDFELMKRANLARIMQVPADKIGDLAAIAQASARQTGQSFEFLFDSIVTGTARQSKLILDNLGIVVSIEKANAAYARELGKLPAKLTDAEKKQAFLNEVLRQGADVIDLTSAAGANAAEPFERFSATMSNLGDEINKLVLPAMSDLATQIEAVADRYVQWIRFVREQSEELTLGDLVESAADAKRMLGELREQQEFLATAMSDGRIGQAEYADGMMKISESIMEVERAARRFRPALQGTTDTTMGEVSRLATWQKAQIFHFFAEVDAEYERSEAERRKKSEEALFGEIEARLSEREREVREAGEAAARHNRMTDALDKARTKAAEEQHKRRLEAIKKAKDEEKRMAQEAAAFVAGLAAQGVEASFDALETIASGERLALEATAINMARRAGTSLVASGTSAIGAGIAELAITSGAAGSQAVITGGSLVSAGVALGAPAAIAAGLLKGGFIPGADFSARTGFAFADRSGFDRTPARTLTAGRGRAGAGGFGASEPGAAGRGGGVTVVEEHHYHAPIYGDQTRAVRENSRQQRIARDLLEKR